MTVAPIENQPRTPPEPPMSGAPRHWRIRSDDDELDRLHRRYATTRDQSVRTELATVYDGFARSLAHRFPSRRETREDLVQVARLGLLHALDRFDPRRNRPFSAFARVTIIGELKRHIRDHSWSMRVPRSLQEDFLVTVRAVDDLTQERGRSPRIAEVAARTGLSEEQILEAMELGTVHQPLSLDAPRRDFEPPGDLGVTDPSFAMAEGRALVDTLLLRLSERDREIFRLRFGEELTQAQIAARFGVSQMCVSRVLSRGLAKLRILVQTGVMTQRQMGSTGPAPLPPRAPPRVDAAALPTRGACAREDHTDVNGTRPRSHLVGGCRMGFGPGDGAVGVTGATHRVRAEGATMGRSSATTYRLPSRFP